MADLRLKHHDEREDQVRQNVAHHPVQCRKFPDASQVENYRYDHQAHQHRSRAGTADHDQDLVDDESHEENIERHPRGLRP